MRLSGIRLGLRFSLAFGLVALIMLAVVAATLVNLRSVRQNAEHVKNESLPFTVIADNISLNVVQVQQWLTDVSATHDTGGLAEADRAAGRVSDGLGRFREMFSKENDIKGVAEIDEIASRFERFYSSGKEMADTYISSGIEEGNALMEGFDAASASLMESVTGLRGSQIREAGLMTEELLSSISTVNRVLVSMTAAAIVLCVVLVTTLAGSITKPVDGLMKIAEKMADGTLMLRSKVPAGTRYPRSCIPWAAWLQGSGTLWQT